MKIAYCSDLHLEMSTADFILTNDQSADILVLAGDIVPINLLANDRLDRQVGRFFNRVSQEFPHVLWVMGNHEFYNGDLGWSTTVAEDKLEHLENVTILDEDTKIIDDITFFGSTLWTDFDNRDPIHMYDAEQMMNDYRLISNSKRLVEFKDSTGNRLMRPSRLTAADTADDHARAVDQLKQVADTNERVVVISHHAPSRQSVHDQYRNHRLNSAYCNNLDSLIEQHPSIELFFHGHVHQVFDYRIGNTRVLCNPRGYPMEETYSNFQLKHVEI